MIINDNKKNSDNVNLTNSITYNNMMFHETEKTKLTAASHT